MGFKLRIHNNPILELLLGTDKFWVRVKIIMQAETIFRNF
jgi:hypothetical protein